MGYDTFTSDLQSMDTQEAKQNRAFEDFTATKQEELIDLKEKLKDAEKAKAEAELLVAEAMQAYDDTTEQVKADIEFFDTEEWKQRKTLREDEVAGVKKALEILSSDDARELFGKAINKPGVQSFLQLDDSTTAPTRKAYSVLKKLATKTQSLRLARLAVSVHMAKAGHFDEVLTSIDTMIGDLQAEAKDDVKKRDQCKDEYQTIESKTKDLDWKIEVNDATIAKLEKS